MPYQYPEIDAMLKGDPNAEPDKANIFAPDANPINPQSGGQGNQGAPQTKTDASSGALLSGSSGGSGASSGENAQAPTQTATTSAALNASNVNRQQQPKIVQDIQGKLAASQSGVQSEADSYIKGAQGQNFDYTPDYLNQAVSGDNDKLNTVQQRLTKTQADPYAKFSFSQDYSVPDVENLKTTSGIEDLFKRGQNNGQYGQNEAAFDAMLLGRNKNFNLTRQDLINQNANLNNTINTDNTTLSDQANKIVGDTYNANTANIKNNLGYINNDMLINLQQQADAQNAARHAQDPAAFAKAQSDAAFKDIISQLQAGGPQSFDARSARLLDQSAVNPAQFVTRGADIGSTGLATQSDADKFNNVMKLLGLSNYGGISHLDPGAAPAPVFNFQTDPYSQLLMGQARDSRSKIDAQDQAQIDAILGANKQQALTSNQARALGAHHYSDPVASSFLPQYGNDLYKYASGVDPAQFYTAGANTLGAENMLDPNEAAQLNSLASDLGVAPNYKAGDAGAADSFNEQAYRDALTAAIVGGRESDARAAERQRANQDQADNAWKTSQFLGSGGLTGILGAQEANPNWQGPDVNPDGSSNLQKGIVGNAIRGAHGAEAAGQRVINSGLSKSPTVDKAVRTISGWR